MAGELKIRSGTRLKLALDKAMGQEPEFDMVCTFAKAVDESAFLVSVPMKDGKPVVRDESQKLLFLYKQGDTDTIVAGYSDDEVKEGIRRYWKIRRVTEQRQFFKRADERLKCMLRVEYRQDTWPLNEDGEIEPEDAMTADVSNGGLSMFVNRRFEVGEICELTLPRLGSTAEAQKIEDVIGVICWMREAPRGSIYRNICGLQFRFGNGTERGRMQDYVAYIKKKYKL